MWYINAQMGISDEEPMNGSIRLAKKRMKYWTSRQMGRDASCEKIGNLSRFPIDMLERSPDVQNGGIFPLEIELLAGIQKEINH
ncbi:hypothetical protein B9Z55_004992 [Caenorhabditis nigoni]|uniref:Uncharacterized protein n=1 Tax=Caenorhabditis nigoni TaxID=1611254 RepID=A0A2G5UZ06_9PELO|nr:hypothetical protein B9Z55_004992 [Caenorhabditis nigoni]